MIFPRAASLCALALLAALAPLRADWKITTVTTFAGHRSVRTEYFKPGLSRNETESPGPSARRLIFVVDTDKRRQIVWDLDSREYMVVRPRPAQVHAAASSKPASVLRIDIVTRDNGERQTFFGHAARHLISTEKHYRQAAPGSPPVLESESSTDAWYIDVPNLPSQKSARLFATLVAGNSQPVIRVSHTGTPLSGLAVQQEITRRDFLRPGRTDVSEETIKVTELSEATLSPQLFEPPANFRRVSRFPGEYPTNSFQMYWQWFEDWLNGLFS